MHLMLRVVPLLIMVGSANAFAAPISGIGQSIDGDSLRVGDTEVRLYGIDAPELTQICQRDGHAWECGSEAAHQLAKLVNGKPVSCTVMGGDTFGRTLGRCRAGVVDINRTMVASGYALAYRRYSSDYVAAEDSARLARRGIWTGTFERPDRVRHAEDDYVLPRYKEPRPGGSMPRASRGLPTSNSGCRIKGNHSRRGERIYHLPGMPYYEETRAEELFCTEAEARAAGYRRSRADQHR